MADIGVSTAGLWLAVIVSGIYHGLNPGMGWPLAVSAALMGDGRRDLAAALGHLAAGHFLAMSVILLPFALMTFLLQWQRELRVGAASIVIAFGVGLLVYRRHPRFLARIKPSHLTFWSFAVAIAHGAGLMLVPIFLGLCQTAEQSAGHQAAGTLMAGNTRSALAVAAIHTAAMVLAGGTMALAVHAWLGLKVLSSSWFNLDTVWALSLIAVGAIGLAI